VWADTRQQQSLDRRRVPTRHLLRVRATARVGARDDPKLGLSLSLGLGLKA